MATAVVIFILAGTAALAIRKMVKDKKAGKSSCGCSCQGCSGKCDRTK